MGLPGGRLDGGGGGVPPFLGISNSSSLSSSAEFSSDRDNVSIGRGGRGGGTSDEMGSVEGEVPYCRVRLGYLCSSSSATSSPVEIGVCVCVCIRACMYMCVCVCMCVSCIFVYMQ